MNIFWHGQSCIKLVDGEFSLLIDPFDKTSGLRQPRYAANLCLITSTNPKENHSDKVAGGPFVISGPGEYESGGTFVYGIASPTTDKSPKSVTMYMFERSGISFAHLGGLAETLSDDRLDRLEGVDVLMLPVGGHDVLTADQASKLIAEIEPRLIIPLKYKISGLRQTYDPLTSFTKVMGVKNLAGQDKLKLVKKDLPQDETKVVVLNKV